jgi:ankyrin repeat protein
VVSANRSVNSSARFSNKKVVAQTGAEGTRVQFETFDSSLDDRRDEKLVFKYINRGDERYLLDHMEQVKDKVDLTKIYDRSGYSPLHFAAFKNFEKICEVLCEHVIKMDSNALEQGDKKTSETLT